MIRIKRYVIRHIPTGKFIPVPSTRTHNGQYSAVEPSDKEHLIRFFVSERSARGFLGQWLLGIHIGKYDGDGGYYVDGYKPVPTRIKSEMEIVPAYMEIN